MKFRNDLCWNYASLIIMAAAGLLMNFIIAAFYNSAILGIFNETYAWYMILSQVTVWGMHMSVLKFVPECREQEKKQSILKASLILTFIMSTVLLLVIEGVLFFMTDLIWSKPLQTAAIGLLFFSLNKVLINYLNAVYEMTAYAVFQSIRYIILIILILLLSLYGVNESCLALSFPITEGILFLLLFLYIFRDVGFAGKVEKRYFKNLLFFGTKILPSNMVLEMNTKVDVVCLGFLSVNTAEIGVYSFAILFTEGFYTLYMIMRKFINPQIAEKNAMGRLIEQIQNIESMLGKYLMLGSTAVYVMILGVYFFIYKLMGKQEYEIGLLFIAIIGLAIAVNGKKIILGDILAQTGYPFEESKLNILTVVSNMILNIIFIQMFGTVGAAAATGISYFIYSMYLKRAVKTKIGVEI